MKNNQGGILLFAIITAFVLSLVGATIVALISNQYRMVQSEIDRLQKYYLLQAGIEHAIYNLDTNPTPEWIPNSVKPVKKQTLSLEIPSGTARVVNISIYDLSVTPPPPGWPSFSLSSPTAQYGIQVTID